MQEDRAFDKNVMNQIKINYRDYVVDGASSTPVEVRPAAPMAPAQGPGGARSMPRRARLVPADFEKYGYTVGCPGCEQLQLQLDQRRGHTEECRARIEEEIAKTDQGKARMARATGRLDHKTAVIGQEEIDKESANDTLAAEDPKQQF